jgi:hypothetical protein
MAGICVPSRIVLGFPSNDNLILTATFMKNGYRESMVLVIVALSIGAFYRYHVHDSANGNRRDGSSPNVSDDWNVDQNLSAADRPTTTSFPSKPSYKATAKMRIDAPSVHISDRIYGVCELPAEKQAEYGIAVTRWGGNPSTRYNWKINADSGASDWYFKNRGKPIASLGENGYLKFLLSAQAAAGTTYQTIPMIGWVAKDFDSYSFPVKRFGKQKATEPGHSDVGNGVAMNGKNLEADPRDTSIEAGPEFVAEAVAYLVKFAGKADVCDGKAGVKYWVLDNEPMLWHTTHRDLHPVPVSYEELWERTVHYAEAIKKVDPSAKVAGFCSWGWTDLFYSAKDEGDDRYGTKPDHRAHDREPLAEWFIRRCGDYKRQHGRTLVDVFDFHWYPQCEVHGKGPYLGKGSEVEFNELRLRSTRDLWDLYYTQESWIKNTGDRKPTRVIRRVREWIERHNPGMELCIGEYNFGGSDNITGALAQADVFGILAREKVDLAFIWYKPEGSQLLAWQLYRSYDGRGGRFGDQLLETMCDDSKLSVFAAKRQDGATTIIAINKDLGGACDFKLDVPALKGKLTIWQFDQSRRGVVEVDSGSTSVDGKIELKLPAASASMLVIK